MNSSRRQKLKKFITTLKKLNDELETVYLEEFHAYSNIPEAIQIDANDLSGDMRQAMEDIGEAIIKLEDSVNSKNRG